MSPQEDILSTLSQHAPELRKSFSVNRIGLFGSFASGNANEESDVDILVELDETSFDHYIKTRLLKSKRVLFFYIIIGLIR